MLDEITVGRASLGAYDASNQAGTAAFDVDVCFDRAVFLGTGADGTYRHAIGFRASNAAASDLSINTLAITSNDSFVLDKNDSGGGSEWKLLTGRQIVRFKFLTPTAAYTHHVAANTESGLTYSRVDFTPPAVASGQTVPEFDSFPLLLSGVDGGVDYTSGTGYVFWELFDKLDGTWNGSSWVSNSNWTARYSSRLSPYFGGNSTRHRAVGKGVLRPRHVPPIP